MALSTPSPTHVVSEDFTGALGSGHCELGARRATKGLGLSLQEKLQDMEGRQGRYQPSMSGRPGLLPAVTPFLDLRFLIPSQSQQSSLERWHLEDAIATREKLHFLLPWQGGQVTPQ